MTAATAAIDVRSIAPRDRHPLIFSRFHTLQPGETLELVNDHDPRPLYFQMQAESPGAFTWTYLESGPQLWRISIAKTRATAPRQAAPAGTCCSGGNCG